MAKVVCTIWIDAPLERVWAEAADLSSHAEWMADAESVMVEGDGPPGPGTRMRVATRVGPLRTTDLMEVTEWQEGRVIGVRHSGIVTGTGRFELTPMEGRTRFTWREDLTFPLWLGGRFTAFVARPVLAWVWRRNLEGLAARLDDPG